MAAGIVLFSFSGLYAAQWRTTAGLLQGGRYHHTATLLPNGKVLVTGGFNGTTVIASAELYDVYLQTWTYAGTMVAARQYHTATLLPNGKVLIVGGEDASSNYLSSCELYDPKTNEWTSTNGLVKGRSYHCAVLLKTGKLMVIAGKTSSGATNTCEVYDYSSNNWQPGRNIANSRYSHSAVSLSDGNVLITGGYATGYNNTSELYVASSDLWRVVGNISSGRNYHNMTLLPGNDVLLTGGTGASGILSSTERFSVTGEVWASENAMKLALCYHTTVLLPNDKVLTIGGFSSVASSACQVYNSVTHEWVEQESMLTARYYHTSTLLPTGQVLVVGGKSSTSSAISNCEVFDPRIAVCIPGPELQIARTHVSACLLPSGKMLLAGGVNTSTIYNTCETYDSDNNTVSQTAYPMINARDEFVTTLLLDGRVLATGGYTGTGRRKECELFDITEGKWISTGDLLDERSLYTQTLLPNGEVMVSGGINNSSAATKKSEVYSTVWESWTATGDMTYLRYGHTANLLVDGKVIVCGGYSGTEVLPYCESYDYQQKSWTSKAQMAEARYNHKSVVLRDGRLLVVGGSNYSSLKSCELYSPIADTWSTAASLPVTLVNHTLVSLDDKILCIGGYNGSTAEDKIFAYSVGIDSWVEIGTRLVTARYGHTAMVMPDKSILIAGGVNSAGTALSSTELLYISTVTSTARKDVVTSFSSVYQSTGTSYTINGTGFNPAYECSSGGYGHMQSAANIPVLNFVGMDSGICTNHIPASWSNTGITYTLPSSLTYGYYFVDIVVGGISGKRGIIKVPAISSAPSGLVTSDAGEGVSTKVNVSWQSPVINGDAYQLERSSNNTEFFFIAKLEKSVTFYCDNSLTPNTTFWYRLSVLNCSGVSAPSSAVTGITRAVVPAGAGITGITDNSLTIVWGHNGNSSLTDYTVELSSTGYFVNTIKTSGWIRNTSYNFTGLAPNTSYYAYIKARSFAGYETSWGVLSTTMTLASVPSVPVIVSVSSTAVRVSLGTDLNPGYTQYAVVVSSDSNTSYYITSAGGIGSVPYWQALADWNTGEGFTVTGLKPNTQYYARVKARNNWAVPVETSPGVASSKYTHATVVGGVVSTVSPDTLKLVINDVYNSTFTKYAIAISSTGWTYYQYISSSGVFASTAVWNTRTGWGEAVGFDIKGLSPNVYYIVRLKSINDDPSSPVETEFGGFIGKYTTALPPSKPGVGYGRDSITLKYYYEILFSTSDGNPGSTEYAVFVATGVNLFYLQGDGTAGGAPVWKTREVWGSNSQNYHKGMSVGDEMVYYLKARNGDLVETNNSPMTVGRFVIENSERKRDVDKDGVLEIAYFGEFGFNRFEDPGGNIVSVSSSSNYDGDGRFEHLINYNNAQAWVYWNPDTDIYTQAGIIDVNKDGYPDILIDVNADAVYDKIVISNNSSSIAESVLITYVADLDGDGMPNIWEAEKGFNALDSSDAGVDSDSDGLINLEEYKNSVDPWKVDTDGGGVSDGREVLVDKTSPANKDDDRINEQLLIPGDVTAGITKTFVFPKELDPGKEYVAKIKLDTEYSSVLVKSVVRNSKFYEWDGKNMDGVLLPSGRYELVLENDGVMVSRSYVLLVTYSVTSNLQQLRVGPNPWSISSGIPVKLFFLPVNTKIEVSIYSVSGELVCRVKPENIFSLLGYAVWDGKNEYSQVVCPGMYIIEVLETSADGKQQGAVLKRLGVVE